MFWIVRECVGTMCLWTFSESESRNLSNAQPPYPRLSMRNLVFQTLFFFIRLLMRNLDSESDALPLISQKKIKSGWLVVIAFDWVVLKIPTPVVSVLSHVEKLTYSREDSSFPLICVYVKSVPWLGTVCTSRVLYWKQFVF